MKKIVTYIGLCVCIIMYVAPLHASGRSNTTPSYKQTAYKKISLVVPIDTEALSIVNALHLNKAAHKFLNLSMQGYAGKYNNFDIFLVSNGKNPINNIQNVGAQTATLTKYLGIQYFHPTNPVQYAPATHLMAIRSMKILF